ncbi:hypothetical protein QJS04_geneDACA003372 [Acorus gramineus]|uniref:Uncharacterized protein n=1 Tax=Acorus gramineus TaxID=55184 RepID=A0AAV9BQY7_ACOGR|nr:hypothetical protein QJS04_geneDACA003372 [Acorus gramineus]
MVERFFFSSSARKHGDDPNKCSDSSMVLLSGPLNCGKTSLLFQFAFNSASEDPSGDVVFICNKRKLESKPPFLSQGIDPSSDEFCRIRMKYIEDDDGIRKYFSAFHLHETFPKSVIIDDFGDFFSDRSCQGKYGNTSGRDLAMVRTLALCRDALYHANEILKPGGPCKLLLCDTHHGNSPRLLYIYKRWVPRIFIVKGDGMGSFTLKDSSSSANTSKGTKVAKYSIALQYLVLEGMIDG